MTEQSQTAQDEGGIIKQLSLAVLTVAMMVGVTSLFIMQLNPVDGNEQANAGSAVIIETAAN